MLRKMLAALLVLVAGLTLVVTAIILLGVWIVKPPITDAVQNTTQSVEELLVLGIETTTTTEREIEEMRRQLEALQTRIENTSPETRAALVEQVAETLQSQYGPAVARVRASVATLRIGLVSLNRSLESANRIPGVDVPTLTDELQSANQLLDELQTNLTALTAAIKDVSIDGSQLEVLLSSTTETLQSFEGILARYETQLEALRSRVLSIGAGAPTVIDWGTVILSLLLVLWGAGQICLTGKALLLYRRHGSGFQASES